MYEHYYKQTRGTNFLPPRAGQLGRLSGVRRFKLNWKMGCKAYAQAKIGFAGRTVDWIEDELDLASDNLRNLAVEQSGGIGHERIWHWLHDTGLTLAQAAEALGISRRMLIYYRDGEKPIPRAIWLACLGWEAVRPTGSTLPQHIPSAKEYAALHA